MTDNTAFLPPAEKPWPPRAEMRFFLLWSVGVLVMAVIGRATSYLSPGWSPGDHGMQVLWLLTAAVGAGWQAWLLFPLGVRSMAWVAGVVATTLLHLRLFNQGLFWWMEPSSLLLAIMEVFLLVGVRRRPWLLAPAALLELLLSNAGTWLWNAFHLSWSTWLEKHFPVGLSSSEILSSALSGLWRLGNLIAAAVIAWWMPPLARPAPRAD
jgi:hypothetical protein